MTGRRTTISSAGSRRTLSCRRSTSERSAVVYDATGAFRYGDQAGGGIVALTPFEPGSTGQVATLGSDAIVRAQAGSDAAGIVAGSFTNNEESRQRTDLFGGCPSGGPVVRDSAGSGTRAGTFTSLGRAFAGSFSFGDATFADPHSRTCRLAVLDRGDYAQGTDQSISISAVWSDSGYFGGISHSRSGLGVCRLGVRASTGFYDAAGAVSRGPAARRRGLRRRRASTRE